MNRYERTRITINKKNQRVRRITRYPRDGDRLDNVAFRYYGDETLWWVIAQANGLGKGRTILNPNFQIRIPGNVTKIISDFENLNR